MLLIACFGVQCSSAQNQGGNEKGMTATFMKSKTIDAKSDNGNHYVSIESGDNLVFEITSTNGGDPKNDTQIKTSLIFEIDPQLASFDRSHVSKSYLQRHCRCIDAGYNILTSGEIRGTKNKNGTWHLTIDVIAEGNDTKDPYSFIYSGPAVKQ